MNNEKNSVDIKFLVGLFLGGIVGALIVFFLGTKEGKKAGKMIEEKGKDVLDDLKSKVGEIELKGKELIERSKEIKTEVEEVLETKKEELTDAATEKLDIALSQIEDLQVQSMSATAAIRKKFFKNLPKKR